MPGHLSSSHAHGHASQHRTTARPASISSWASGISAAPAFGFGSFVAAASQLQRRQHAIEQLARGVHLDPAHIGITPACDCPRWLLFHDPRDLLSLPTKALFGDCPWIHEAWVENKVSARAPAHRFPSLLWSAGDPIHPGHWPSLTAAAAATVAGKVAG